MSRTANIFCCMLLLCGCGKLTPGIAPSQSAEPGPANSGSSVENNGLTGTDREEWYQLSQGSEIYPYRFMKALYRVEEDMPFLQNLDRYGLIDRPRSDANPYGMPIGISVAITRDLHFAGVKMVGVNCAACHTALLEKGGQRAILVDGGQNLFDINAFIGDLAKNTEATLNSPDKLFEFVVRLIRNDELPDAPVFGARVLAAGGEAVFRDASQLRGLDSGGAAERAFAKKFRSSYEQEIAKPAKTLGESLKVNADAESPELKDYSIKAKTAVGSSLLKAAPKVIADSRALRDRAWGRTQDIVGDLKQIAGIPPTAGSELSRLTAEARELSFIAAIDNLRETIGLLKARRDFLKALLTGRGGVKTTPGPGRVDAFGSARNAMFPHAPVELTAPVGFPSLWHIRQTHWYHWDNNTTSIDERNVGEAIGVGAIYNRQSHESTVQLDNIMRLEALAGKLTAPKWPAAALGAIDAVKAARGQAIFVAKCAECHNSSLDPNTGKHIERMQPFDVVATDPMRATNFAIALDGRQFVDSLSPLLKNIIKANGRTPGDKMQWRTTKNYGARPLNGVWATAPYLHNNSVPTIFHLLKPAGERPGKFLVGHRDYDAEKLGYTLIADSSRPMFDTSVTGNGNGGHSGDNYGTNLTDEERLQLIEYLKGL